MTSNTSNISNSEPRRIWGVFTKQVWGGRKGNDAIYIGTEEFDATFEVLKLTAPELSELQDGHESSDFIGREKVEWDGPCEVRLVDSVKDYFGVESLEDITAEMLNKARIAFEAEVDIRTNEEKTALPAVSNGLKFRVLGAHPNRTFFDIAVEAKDGLSAFGAAALVLREAGEEGDAEFFAAIPEGVAYELPGEGVVCLQTVLDPEQAEVFGIETGDEVTDRPRPSM
jgi:hypothetical protein